MRHSARTVRYSTGLLLVSIISLFACHKSDGARAVAEKVAAIPCFSSDVEKDLADAGERLGSLSRDESATGDAALVMLLGYYLGEHNSEELEIEIVRRGKRMKPLLIQEQHTPAVLSTCAPRNKADLVKSLVDDAIRRIDQGASTKQAER